MSQDPVVVDYGTFFTAMGVVSAIAFTSIGAAYATAKAGVATLSVGVIRPEVITKSLIPIVMGGIIAIYGLIVCVLIATKYGKGENPLAKHYTNFGAGLAVGLSGLASGVAIGIIGDAGVRGVAQQQRLFIGMIIILIFAEVLGLYGLIVAILMMAVNE